MPSLLAIAVALIAVLGVTLLLGAPRSPAGAAGTTLSPLPLSPAVSGGITESRAIELAQVIVTPESTLRSVSAGRFAEVYTNDRMGPSSEGQAEQLVWAVRYESMYTICPPDGLPCWTPRPGTTTVILDYYTGSWITTFSYSPP